jgi:Helicase associated domain
VYETLGRVWTNRDPRTGFWTSPTVLRIRFDHRHGPRRGNQGTHADVQAAGRALRKAPGKSCGYILLCTYVATPENESIEEAARRTKFDTLLDVLQALKEWDEKFVDLLRELAQPRARAKGYADWILRDKVEFIGPEVLLEALEKSIRVEVIDRLIPRWEKSFAEVAAFKEQNGRWPVATLAKDRGEELALGQCCHMQRKLRQRGLLSPERIVRLDALGFVWEQARHKACESRCSKRSIRRFWCPQDAL